MPHPVAADVDEDPVEPGVEPILVAQRLPTRPGAGDGLLRGIFGFVPIAQDERGEPVAHKQARVIECGEGLEALPTRAIRRIDGETPATVVRVRDRRRVLTPRRSSEPPQIRATVPPRLWRLPVAPLERLLL